MAGLAPKDLGDRAQGEPGIGDPRPTQPETVGFVEQIGETGRYRLGPALVCISVAHATASDARHPAP